MKEIKLNSQNFNQEVLNSNLPAIVDFWATWCGPCRMIAPTIEALAEELDGKVKVGKVNVDEEMALATEYGIEVIPTLIFFKDKKAVKKVSGVMDKAEILSILENL